jgi:hypothetical protein
MKKVYIADNPMDAHLVRGVLENEGIECFVENEGLTQAMGEVPPTMDCLPAVVVVEPADHARAEEIVTTFKKSRKPPPEDADEEVGGPTAFTWITLALVS